MYLKKGLHHAANGDVRLCIMETLNKNASKRKSVHDIQNNMWLKALSHFLGIPSVIIHDLRKSVFFRNWPKRHFWPDFFKSKKKKKKKKKTIKILIKKEEIIS